VFGGDIGTIPPVALTDSSQARPGEPPGRRRRRSREAARGEILAAAEAFLVARPFRELSVEEVMADTTLSRSSFYVYFRDRHDLLLCVVQEIGGQLFEQVQPWLEGGLDPPAEMRRALGGVVRVYAEHGPVMRAISDASTSDPLVEAVYHGLVDDFVRAVRERVAEQPGGDRARNDPDDLVYALVWMTERYLSQSLGAPTPRVDRERATSTLQDVWVSVLYG